MLTVNELFAGIGAFRKALINLGIPHKVVGISEIDRFAIKSYEALYGETYNYGDISKVEALKYADMWTYGFPCQDISRAGAEKGIVKGETRSGLLYEVQRLLEVARDKNELPKYLILENVKNLVGKKFIAQFSEWLDWLSVLGYNSYWQVLNAKDYGVPQNRERVFAVSIRKDVDNGFEFPKPIPLKRDLIDTLENEVDEKYYLSEGYIKYATGATAEMVKCGNGFKFRPVERERERERERRQPDNCKGYNVESGSENDRQLHSGAYPPLVLDKYNKRIRENGIVGTITTNPGSTGHNSQIIEVLSAECSERRDLSDTQSAVSAVKQREFCTGWRVWRNGGNKD